MALRGRHKITRKSFSSYFVEAFVFSILFIRVKHSLRIDKHLQINLLLNSLHLSSSLCMYIYRKRSSPLTVKNQCVQTGQIFYLSTLLFSWLDPAHVTSQVWLQVLFSYPAEKDLIKAQMITLARSLRHTHTHTHTYARRQLTVNPWDHLTEKKNGTFCGS